MNFDWQTIITISALVVAICTLVGKFANGVRWFDNQSDNGSEIAELREKHEADLRSVQEEQTLLVYGILACLKGLKEQGCNGPVTEAISRIEKHLNQKAHGTQAH